jgi:pimeloyl-ACP methyl ester carboxylesterase
MQQKTLNYQQANISYKVYGSGKPVMLIHGFAEDSRIWDRQVIFLQEQYQLIVPDLPGSGSSSALQQENVQIDGYADVMNSILENEKVEKLTMIGHSMGGYITLAFAEKFPDKLNAFGLVHSSAFADDEEKKQTRKKAIAFIEQNGAASFLETSIPGLFFDSKKSEEDISTLLQNGKDFLPEALIQYYTAMIYRPDRTAVLHDFKKPVLLIIGEHDKAIPFNQSMKQTHIPPIAFIHILRNAAHMGMLEETENANKYLAEFLQSAE